MIYLTKGQKLFNNEGMVVCDPTGYYEDGVTVACAVFHSPDEPVFRYEAKFIAYGDQVYNIADEKKLMEEILKIDPESLFGKTNAEVVVDNLVNEIKTVDSPTPELTQDAVDINNANVEKLDTSTNNIPSDTTTTTETTTYDPETDTTTTETTIVKEEIVPEVIDPIIEVPAVQAPIIPEVVIPEVPVVPEGVIPPAVDQVVSKIKSTRKIV
jgi:hypothetical protein